MVFNMVVILHFSKPSFSTNKDFDYKIFTIFPLPVNHNGHQMRHNRG